jgi:hypothetical protein
MDIKSWGSSAYRRCTNHGILATSKQKLDSILQRLHTTYWRTEMTRHISGMVKQFANEFRKLKRHITIVAVIVEASSSGDIDAIIQCDARSGILCSWSLLEKRLHAEHFAFGERRKPRSLKMMKYRHRPFVGKWNRYPFAPLYLRGPQKLVL